MSYAHSTKPGQAPNVGSLLDAVQRLDDAALVDFLDALAGSQRVEVLGWRVQERRLSRERFPERNQEIRELVKRLSYAQIGRLFGMSRYAVRNVVKRRKEV